MKEELEFLRESNNIEGEYSDVALIDAMRAWECWPSSTLFNSALEIHNALMKRLRPDIAGKLRDVGVRVGRSYPPAPELVRGLLKEWSRKWHGAKEADAIQEAHVDFEHIHPFEDGNGRTGRIIYNRMRLDAGLSIHIIKNADKQSYYKWFTPPSNE